jgi:hypothetical protein
MPISLAYLRVAEVHFRMLFLELSISFPLQPSKALDSRSRTGFPRHKQDRTNGNNTNLRQRT